MLMVGNQYSTITDMVETCNITSWSLGQKKIVMLPSPDQNLKIGSVGRFFFFFFFTYRERVEFSNIFFKVSKWGKLGRNAVKTHIQVLF